VILTIPLTLLALTLTLTVTDNTLELSCSICYGKHLTDACPKLHMILGDMAYGAPAPPSPSPSPSAPGPSTKGKGKKRPRQGTPPSSSKFKFIVSLFKERANTLDLDPAPLPGKVSRVYPHPFHPHYMALTLI
jgi:hypothetical protein